MYKLSQTVVWLLRIGLQLSLWLLLSNISYAGGDHDHGHDHGHNEDDTVKTTIATLPRIIMESRQFELVGILDAQELHFYLDDYNTNEPVNKASIEIELAGERLQAKADPQHESSYHIILPNELTQGVYPVLATIVTQQGADLLTGELDIHPHAEATDNSKITEKKSPLTIFTQAIHPSWIALISLLLLLLLGFVLLRDRQKRGVEQ